MYIGYCDGGSRNNTHAACAWIITNEDNEILYSNSLYLANRSNNDAEYFSIIFLMSSALAGKVTELKVIQDSELVSRQMNGQYQVKAPNLKPLYMMAQDLARKFDRIEFTWAPREHPMISICDMNCDLCIEHYKN